MVNRCCCCGVDDGAGLAAVHAVPEAILVKDVGHGPLNKIQRQMPDEGPNPGDHSIRSAQNLRTEFSTSIDQQSFSELFHSQLPFQVLSDPLVDTIGSLLPHRENRSTTHLTGAKSFDILFTDCILLCHYTGVKPLVKMSRRELTGIQ